MSYKKIADSIEEYIGESFIRDYRKSGEGNAWGLHENLRVMVYDTNGDPVFGSDGEKYDNDMAIRIVVPYDVTEDFTDGQYLILIYLIDTLNTGIRDVVAEYKVKYLKPKV